MIVTTTPKIEGKQIYEHLGIVTGVYSYLVGGILGEGLLVADGYFNTTYKKAEEKMIEKAKELGADAIVGVQFTSLGMDTPSRSMFITLIGTAVKTVDEALDELPEL